MAPVSPLQSPPPEFVKYPLLKGLNMQPSPKGPSTMQYTEDSKSLMWIGPNTPHLSTWDLMGVESTPQND